MQNSDRSILFIFDIYMQNMPKNMLNICRICKKYVKKYANLFGICRIVTCSYSAYLSYICTTHFADVLGKASRLVLVPSLLSAVSTQCSLL